MASMDENNQELDFGSALQDFEAQYKNIKSGDIVMGKIIGTNGNDVFVDIGYKSDGLIPIEEFTDVNENPSETIGKEIEVMILRVNDVEGTVSLSRKKVETMRAWEQIEGIVEQKVEISAVVTQTVKSGVLASWKGIRIFIPASQLELSFVKDLEMYKGKTLRIKIIEFTPKAKKIVGSQKIVLQEEKEKHSAAIWKDIALDRRYLGEVKNLTNFGAFVDIGGIEGLVHISDLSWGKIRHASEVLEIGQRVEVTVKDFNIEKGKISLNYRRADEDPWKLHGKDLIEDQVYEVKVIRMMPFGAFVELFSGIEGLVHVSQISDHRIVKPSDVLQEGQIVQAKLTAVDHDTKKISMSIKEVEPINKKQSGESSTKKDEA